MFIGLTLLRNQMAFSLLSSLRQFEKHWPCPEERIADVECATFEG